MLSDPWAVVCSSPSLLAFWVPLCILPVYELESLFLGFFLIYLLFTDKKKKKLSPLLNMKLFVSKLPKRLKNYNNGLWLINE